MKSLSRFPHIVLFRLVVLSFVFFPLAVQANQGTRFRDLPRNDPKSQVVQTVLGSSRYSMKSQFSAQEWRSGHYGGAWQRARQYFPNRMYYTESSQYFMTHGFSSKGRLYMQVFNSDLFRSCTENRNTFTNRNIVSSYSQMRSSGNEQAVRDFQKKLGQLESYFRDEASKNRLKKMLGSALYNQLLKELREENYHVLAGAMMHEGMHAKMDNDRLVAEIQQEFKSCKLKIQWDEQRAYMAEINYHSRFYFWALNNMHYHWSKIAQYLADLERLRNKRKPLSEADKEKIEKIKAKIKAHIAIIRVRLREIEQSAQRMNFLIGNFKKDYVKSDAPADARQKIDKLAASIASFVAQVGQTIQNVENILKELEQLLKLWNEWAECKKDKPPPKGAGDGIVKKVRKIDWPSPPVKETEELKEKADDEIVKKYAADPAGRPEILQGVTFSGGVQISSVSMKTVNEYIDTLNTVWQGDVPGFDWNTGFRISLGWRFSPYVEVGAAFERQEGSTSGTLVVPASDYTSEHTLSVYGLYINGMTKEVAPRVRLMGQFGLGLYSASYRETENSFVTEGKDTTIGWNIATGIDYTLSNDFALTLQTGYRNATLDDFGVSFFLPGNPPVTLEFSGPYAQIGLAIRF